MITCFAVSILCWCCALLAVPRKRAPDDGMEERIALHRLGRHARVTRLAIAATLLACGLALFAPPQRPDATLSDVRLTRATCGRAPYGVGAPTCYALQPGGRWAEEERQGDGRWVVVATMERLPARATPADYRDGIKG